GLDLKDTNITQLGTAAKVVVTKDSTTIVEGAGDVAQIEGRVNQIRAQMEETTSDFDHEKLQERLAKLAGGVAVVKVGAATETELKELEIRIEVAIDSTQAAVEEGLLSGGITALVSVYLEEEEILEKVDGDVATVVKNVLRALKETVLQI